MAIWHQANQTASTASAPATCIETGRLPNVLLINGHFPVFPGSGGQALEFLNTTHLAGLAPHVGLVSMAHTAEALAGVQAFTARGVETYVWRSPRIGASGRRCPPPAPLLRGHAALVRLLHALKAFPSRPHDTMVADLEFRNMAGPLLEALSRRHWHVVVVVQSSLGAVLDYIPPADVSVLVMHDIRSRVFARRAEVARSRWQRACLREQARRYLQFEKKYAQRYDLLIAVSETDAQWIRQHYEPRRVEVTPIPVDTDYFAPVEGCESDSTILFTGLMDHPPNVDAAVFFAREVFPRIRERVAEAEFLVVGKSPAREVLKLAGLPGVRVTGWVPDTRPYLARAAVVVVPLRFGSGVRIKILEAWGMQKCVVSTAIGAEGLGYEHAGNILIAEGAAGLAEAALEAMRNPALRRRLGAAGRGVAVAQHAPARIAQQYYGHLRSVAQEKGRPARMGVVLDMRWLTPGLAGGLENLARSFVRELLALDASNRYTLIVPAQCRYDFDLRHRPNFRVVCRDSFAPLALDALWHASALLHQALRLEYWRSREVRQLEFLRSLDADIAYSFPGYIHPELDSLRQVLMVPDLQHEYFPGFFSESVLRERRRIYTESIHRADHICAISDFTRQTLIERLGVAAEKITTVLLAADPIFRPARQPEADRRQLARYRLPEEPYLFFPAHTWHHKNHRAVVKALVILRDRYGLAPQLICTGGVREAQAALQKQVEESGLRSQVRFLGYCPREHLPALYRMAGCLIFPSLFEGFGMPVLEAMACGCPVVCSNTTSLPEVAGRAALLVDANDQEALAEAIRDVLSDRDLRDRLIELGFAQAARFSWRRHAVETLAVLRRVHEQSRSAASS